MTMHATMSHLQSQVVLPPHEGAGTDSELRSQVWGLLSTLYPKVDLAERRCEMRYPFPHLVHLTPVGEDGITPCGQSLVVVGKHISQRGLGFYHPKPLPYRRMIASLESANGWFGFLIDIGWCRFTRQGWYESGGRFLQSVASPLAIS
ncbi:MAG: hypothetical protein ABR915_25875 [Thermoguttaceae bacterium]|jgi:hypothetical protein